MTTRPVVGESLPAKLVPGFSAEQVARYAEASGDRNPIHLDPAVAKAAGLADCAVHGMLVMGQFERCLLGWWGDAVLTDMSARFVKPVLLGEDLRIEGRVAQQLPGLRDAYIVRLVVRNPHNAITCIGDAQVQFDRMSPLDGVVAA